MQQRVMITENNGDMKRLYQSILQQQYDIQFADDGATVVNSLSSPPDIYLLNSRLPDMSVTELCDYLHEQPVSRDIPILILSAADEIATYSEECPAEGYIRKPFTAAELRAMVQKLLVPDMNH